MLPSLAAQQPTYAAQVLAPQLAEVCQLDQTLDSALLGHGLAARESLTISARQVVAGVRRCM